MDRPHVLPTKTANQGTPSPKMEMVYLGFREVTFSPKTKPGCVLLRLTTDAKSGGKHWKQRHLSFPDIVYPEDRSQPTEGTRDVSKPLRTLCAAGQDGYIVFNCYQGLRYGLMLVFPNDTRQFLPLEEPTDTVLFGIEFSDDTKTIVLLYHDSVQKTPGANLNSGGFTTRFVRIPSQPREAMAVIATLPGWSAHTNTRYALLVDEAKKPYTYDLLAKRRVPTNKETAPNEARIQRLLDARNSPQILIPQTNRFIGKFLPATVYGSEKMWAISPDIGSMFEMEMIEIGPPNLDGRIEPDWSDDFVLDGVFAPSRGFLWTIKRGSHNCHSGFQFTNREGTAFRFFSPGPIRMGSYKGRLSTVGGIDQISDLVTQPSTRLPAYPPGIYEVDMVRKSVRRIAPPGQLSPILGSGAGSVRGDLFMRDQAAAGFFFMRQGVKK